MLITWELMQTNDRPCVSKLIPTPELAFMCVQELHAYQKHTILYFQAHKYTKYKYAKTQK